MPKASTAAALINPVSSTDQNFLNDPYPMLARLRQEAPVYWSKADRYWIISRYADVSTVLRSASFEKQLQNWKHAPSPIVVNLIPHMKSVRVASNRWLLNLNPPDHARVRSLLNRAFTAPIVQGLRPFIKETAEMLLDRVSGRDQIDLVSEYALPLPMMVIGHMLGVPVTRQAELKEWSTNLAALAGRHRDIPALMAAGKAVEQLSDYLKPSIEARRLAPQDDLLTVLVQAEQAGDKLKVDELVANCVLLLIAGHETTTNLIGNAFISLLKNPDQLKLLREQPQMMQAMINEVLRYESPAQTAPRLAKEDITLSSAPDKIIKAGDMCWTLLGSANRDEDEFEQADRFDITRQGSKHLTFGEGIHRCIGASLAEVELEIAMQVFLERYSDFSLAEKNIDFRIPFSIRGPKQLLVGLHE